MISRSHHRVTLTTGEGNTRMILRAMVMTTTTMTTTTTMDIPTIPLLMIHHHPSHLWTISSKLRAVAIAIVTRVRVLADAIVTACT
jgi:hypothetical protein